MLPAYEFCLKCSHTFNLLDARGAISVTERTGFIARIRNLARACAEAYLSQREAMGFPLVKNKDVSPLARQPKRMNRTERVHGQRVHGLSNEDNA